MLFKMVKIMAERGGARKGAGRPKGLSNQKSQELIIKATEQGISPMEVLLNDMRFYYELGEREFAKIKDQESEEIHREVFLKANSLKMIARECAKDVAPYIHAKLSSIDAKVAVTNFESALAELD